METATPQSISNVLKVIENSSRIFACPIDDPATNKLVCCSLTWYTEDGASANIGLTVSEPRSARLNGEKLHVWVDRDNITIDGDPIGPSAGNHFFEFKETWVEGKRTLAYLGGAEAALNAALTVPLVPISTSPRS